VRLENEGMCFIRGVDESVKVAGALLEKIRELQGISSSSVEESRTKLLSAPIDDPVKRRRIIHVARKLLATGNKEV